MKAWRDHDGVVVHSVITITFVGKSQQEYSVRCRPGRVFGDRYTTDPVNCLTCLALFTEGRWV